jgi:predicted ATP-grasp superfamily ATP-dependent carboligase
MKSLLFLGGGQLGLPTVKWAKEIGFNVIVNDRNKHAPGLEFADVKLHYDSTDIRGLSTWVLKWKNDYNIQYCYCGSDFGLVTVAVIHDILSIHYPSTRSILGGLDKLLMKESWEKADINFPRSITLSTLEHLSKIKQEIKLPIVVKPSSSSGSRGVSIISELTRLDTAFDEAQKYAEDGIVILEEYIDGSHHDVNGLFWNGRFHHCGVGDRFFTPPPYPVPKHGYFPSNLTEKKKTGLYEALRKGAIAQGINHGPVKADCVINNGKIFVYEISPRFHGDIFTANTLNYLYKNNPIYQLLKLIYDEEYQFMEIENKQIVAGWKTLFHGNEDRYGQDGINMYVIHPEYKNNPNTTIKNNTDIYGLIWATAKSYDQVNKNLNIE